MGFDETDEAFIRATPISRARMDLLWLDPPHLAELEAPLAEHGRTTFRMETSGGARDHSITQSDYEWAKSVEAVVDKAYAAGQAGLYDVAIRCYKEALGLAPGCDLFLMSIGSCYAMLGNVGAGLSYLTRAAELDPDNGVISMNLRDVRGMV